ncbi:MAG: formylglycine-generating enzyme family protein, partial [Victivallaceae bacterium]
IESNTRTLTYLKLADYNINQGNVYLVRAKNTYLSIHSGIIRQEDEGHPEKKYKLKEDLTKLEAEFNNQYDLAIEYLSRVEALGLKHEQITSSLARIYRNRLEFSILTGNYNETRKLIEMLRLRRRKAFYDIIENDSQLCESVKMIIQGEGKLSVNSTPPGVRITGYKVDNFRDFDPANYESIFSGQTPLKNKKLATGYYILMFKKPELPDIRYPLHIVRGKFDKIDVFIPPVIPAGMAYIPAGTVSLDAQIKESQLNNNIFVPGFFIKKHKVSFGEYLLFWKSLASQSDRRKFMGKFVSESEDRSFMNLWDKEGILREPFKPDMPVIGVTGQAAKAYCLWLSEKTKMDCRLPSSYEWERAALGVADRKLELSSEPVGNRQLSSKAAQKNEPNAGEVSVFGIFDMISAVGEFTTINLPGVKGFQIRGEKSLGGDNANYNSFTSFSNGASSNDVGFRYVVPLKSGSGTTNQQLIPVDDNP